MPEGRFSASEATRAFSFALALEAVAGAGEDCHFGRVDERSVALCVADGCGGSGARRYATCGDRTGASLASELAVSVFAEWLDEHGAQPVPRAREEGEAWARDLEQALRTRFHDYRARTLGIPDSPVRGSLVRTLPTTFCALLAQPDGQALDALALWAGDSRAYALAADGLRQLTRDDVAVPDAMASLRADPPLRNVVDADAAFTLHARAMRLPAPCALLCVSDGAYAYLPTPMEFELLLLRTLEVARSASDWAERLKRALAPVAGDDATLLLSAAGYADFAQLRLEAGKRRPEMQRRFVTPVRRRKQDAAYATRIWQAYRADYEWNEEAAHGDDLRRV